MANVRFWSMEKFCVMIMEMLTNKFDCLIIIEGNRGLGKSTLAWHILKKVSAINKQIVKVTGGKESPYFKQYQFKPVAQTKGKFKSVIYTKEDVINFFDKWHHSALADEMINVAFNREFWNEDQKNIIKLMNMNRDHCNLFVACVPQFQTLDNQIKNLAKIRITIARRGLAVIQTPNRTIYNRDRWDTATNEKIEREWLKKGSGLPQYSRLNTFRGMLRFPALSKKEQAIYDQIKVGERNIIKKDLGVTEENGGEKQDALTKVLNKLIDGSVRNGTELEGCAFAMGLTKDQLMGRLKTQLGKLNKPTQLSQYYWDKKAKRGDDEEFKSIN